MTTLTRQEMLLISKFVIKARDTIKNIDKVLANVSIQSLKTRNKTLMRGVLFVAKTPERYQRFVGLLVKEETPNEFLQSVSRCTDLIAKAVRGEGVEGVRFFAVVSGHSPIGPFPTKPDAIWARRIFCKNQTSPYK